MSQTKIITPPPSQPLTESEDTNKPEKVLPPIVQEHMKNAKKHTAIWHKRFSTLVKKHSKIPFNAEACPKVEDYQIYFCWLQGEENMPPVVRCCYNSLKMNAGSYKIIFLDDNNLFDYVEIAPHIMDKFREGKMSRTHFSDILRVNLLEKYGGLWLDATILVTERRWKIIKIIGSCHFSL